MIDQYCKSEPSNYLYLHPPFGSVVPPLQNVPVVAGGGEHGHRGVDGESPELLAVPHHQRLELRGQATFQYEVLRRSDKQTRLRFSRHLGNYRPHSTCYLRQLKNK